MSSTQNRLNKNISKVFEEIQNTISAVGETGFLKMLVEIREDKNLVYQNETAKTVIQIVSKEFNIPVRELLYGNTRVNDKTQALGIITLILVQHYDFTLKEVSTFLNKNNTNLSRYKKEADNYDPNHPLDIKRIEKLESIKHKLKLIQTQNE